MLEALNLLVMYFIGGGIVASLFYLGKLTERRDAPAEGTAGEAVIATYLRVLILHRLRIGIALEAG
jgi:hypothetical protein